MERNKLTILDKKLVMVDTLELKNERAFEFWYGVQFTVLDTEGTSTTYRLGQWVKQHLDGVKARLDQSLREFPDDKELQDFRQSLLATVETFKKQTDSVQAAVADNKKPNPVLIKKQLSKLNGGFMSSVAQLEATWREISMHEHQHLKTFKLEEIETASTCVTISSIKNTNERLIINMKDIQMISEELPVVSTHSKFRFKILFIALSLSAFVIIILIVGYMGYHHQQVPQKIAHTQNLVVSNLNRRQQRMNELHSIQDDVRITDVAKLDIEPKQQQTKEMVRAMLSRQQPWSLGQVLSVGLCASVLLGGTVLGLFGAHLLKDKQYQEGKNFMF